MDPIYSLVEKLAILEGRITPTSVKHGLNAQQKSVHQLPALFKPKDISPVLTSQDYPKDPMDGYLVGEAEVAEDMLDKVKKSFADYLQNVEDRIKDDHGLGEPGQDRDILSRKPNTRDLVAKQVTQEDPAQEDPVTQTAVTPDINPTLPEDSHVRSIALEDGRICEIHGNDQNGFEIKFGDRALKSKFSSLDEAQMALDMFAARRRNKLKQDLSQDYIEEK